MCSRKARAEVCGAVSNSFGKQVRSQKERSKSTCLLNISLGETDSFILEPGFLGPAGTDPGLAPESSGYFLLF